MAKSHFLLHTSQREGFGLTILEANSQAVPAAVFNVSALGEIVTHNKTGIVVETQQTDKMANKIINIFDNKLKYKNIANQAYKFSKQFDWKKSQIRFLQIIEKVYD